MHGVKRVHQSSEAIQARKLKEQAKITEYLALANDVLSRKTSEDWSLEAFRLTTRLLRTNPEFYTVWNYRRNICLQGIFPNSSPEAIYELICEDLVFTMNALKVHPKVYWIWNHRRWCLNHVPEGPNESDLQGWKKASWERELAVVEKILDADARNFHAWSYRRYVLASMPVSRTEESELAYTAKKIESNFSNFSAWHQRSKVYSSLCESRKLQFDQFKKQELELVRNAMYTDPDDQSVWIYHRWLMGAGDDSELLLQEITAIQELLDEQPDSKWCMECILHYKLLLLQKHSTIVDVKAVSEECQTLLQQLKAIDPYRRRRYDDLAAAVLRL
ncbi:rab-protein geranylgeranyltransferase [Amanita muscaria]